MNVLMLEKHCLHDRMSNQILSIGRAIRSSPPYTQRINRFREIKELLFKVLSQKWNVSTYKQTELVNLKNYSTTFSLLLSIIGFVVFFFNAIPAKKKLFQIELRLCWCSILMMIDFVKKGLEFYGKWDNLRKTVRFNSHPLAPLRPFERGRRE